jgi:hypothetical protein
MASKKSKQILEDFMQAHGMEEKQRFEPTTLEQIWGNDGYMKYNTFDEDVYAERLSEMNKTDLQKEAKKRGLVPIDDTKRLREGLMKDFRLYVAGLNAPMKKKEENKEIPTDVLKTLAEGR